MARNLMKTADAIERIDGIASGLNALVSMLFATPDADAPGGKELAELIWPMQTSLLQQIEEAREGMREK